MKKNNFVPGIFIATLALSFILFSGCEKITITKGDSLSPSNGKETDSPQEYYEARSVQSLLTGNYEKNPDEYKRLLLGAMRTEWDKKTQNEKKAFAKAFEDREDFKNLSHEEKENYCISHMCIGYSWFGKRIQGIYEGMAEDSPRVSVEKAKSLVGFLYESFAEKSEEEISRARETLLLRSFFTATEPDFESNYDSMLVDRFYATDDTLTKYIYCNNGYGSPVYIELDESRKNVIKTEILCPEFNNLYKTNISEADYTRKISELILGITSSFPEEV